MAGLYGKGSYFDNDGDSSGPSPSCSWGEVWQDMKRDVKNFKISEMSEFGVACCFYAVAIPALFVGVHIYQEYFKKQRVQNSDGKIVFMSRHELKESSRNNIERLMKEEWERTRKR